MVRRGGKRWRCTGPRCARPTTTVTCHGRAWLVRAAGCDYTERIHGVGPATLAACFRAVVATTTTTSTVPDVLRAAVTFLATSDIRCADGRLMTPRLQMVCVFHARSRDPTRAHALDVRWFVCLRRARTSNASSWSTTLQWHYTSRPVLGTRAARGCFLAAPTSWRRCLGPFTAVCAVCSPRWWSDVA